MSGADESSVCVVTHQIYTKQQEVCSDIVADKYLLNERTHVSYLVFVFLFVFFFNLDHLINLFALAC